MKVRGLLFIDYSARYIVAQSSREERWLFSANVSESDKRKDGRQAAYGKCTNE